MADIYEIRTVKDFLTVPEEKREAMLVDFVLWLRMVSEFNGLFDGVIAVDNCFKWVDDGLNGCKEINLRIIRDDEKEQEVE